jgi:glutamate/tyrosine decarboxylase-like PLP-dependent enzyme
MVCRNICEKKYSKIVVGESHYSVGKRCECCGMQLRVTPSEREYKEKMRENLITINKKKAA